MQAGGACLPVCSADGPRMRPSASVVVVVRLAGPNDSFCFAGKARLVGLTASGGAPRWCLDGGRPGLDALPTAQAFQQVVGGAPQVKLGVGHLAAVVQVSSHALEQLPEDGL